MAIDFYINPLTGDIDITNNLMRRTSTVEELARQQVAIVLRTFRGEWIFNVLFGVPYLANDNNTVQLLGKTRQRVIDAALKQAIVGRESITRITKYESTVDEVNRTMSVSFQAATLSGELVSFDNININV